jgi:hypothetical protein
MLSGGKIDEERNTDQRTVPAAMVLKARSCTS